MVTTNQFRIWNKLKNCWVSNKDNVVIKLDGKLYKNGIFSFFRNLKFNNKLYVIHNYVATDIENNPIYEGDIVKYISGNEEYICLVVYSKEIASYVLIETNTENHYFFTFTPNINIKIIGNIIENSNLIKNEVLRKAAKTITRSEE